MDVNHDSSMLEVENCEMRYLKNAEQSIDLGIKDSYVRVTKNSLTEVCDDLLESEIEKTIPLSKPECDIKEPHPFMAACNSFCHCDSADSSLNQRFISEKWCLLSSLSIKKLFITGEIVQTSEIEQLPQEVHNLDDVVRIYNIGNDFFAVWQTPT